MSPDPTSIGSVTPTILAVEDNPSQQLVLRVLGKMFGYEILLVSTGQEAIDTVMSGRSIAAILMDLKLPDMGGIDCTREIRLIKSAEHVPIIAYTACVMPGDKENCLTNGMDDYLGKPHTADELHAVLAKWLK